MGQIRKIWHARGYPWGIWAVACAMLLAMAGGNFALIQASPDAEGYHRRVTEATAHLPTRFDDWVSTDAPVPPSAIAMLHPNVIVSRKYSNLVTGQQVSLLLVQCRDARDLLGHYPPVCYKSAGYNKTAADARDWQVDDLLIHGMRYEFSSASTDRLTSMVVCNFMVLPDGTTCRDMDGVNAAARDPRKRRLGAAQIQIIVDPGLSPEELDALVRTFVIAHRPVINAMLAGGH